MEKRDKKALLTKFLANRCSPQELAQVMLYLQQPDGDAEVQLLLDEAWEQLQLYPEVDATLSERMYAGIQARTTLAGGEAAPAPAQPASRQLSTWLRLAAVFTGALLLAGIAYLLQLQAPITERTGYGQVATITLPDQSVVKLNGNSRLRYRRGWGGTAAREVWLEGEAFFSVTHTQNHQKFIVHTADNFNVEVLGTSFNVLGREDRTRVVLNSGKIRLHLGQSAQARQVTMVPGELIEFEKKPEAYRRQRVESARFSAWTQNKLVFDATPLSEVVAILRDTYGVQVTVADPALLRKQLWGSVPGGKASLLLTALETSFGLKVVETDGQVLLSENTDQ